jgi:hypothetical protein
LAVHYEGRCLQNNKRCVVEITKNAEKKMANYPVVLSTAGSFTLKQTKLQKL